jgi:hypothetical protein
MYVKFDKRSMMSIVKHNTAYLVKLLVINAQFIFSFST